MYAIIKDSGTQIKVEEGDVVKVAVRPLAAGVATMTFDQVLLVSEGQGKTALGQPLVAGAKVTADVLAQERGPKTISVRFRRRKRVLKRRGHRQDYLKVKITSIQGA